MLIKKIQIEKFRGFKNVEFDLGENITIIAGQNGTQKTTILGLLKTGVSRSLHPHYSILKNNRLPLSIPYSWKSHSPFIPKPGIVHEKVQ